MSGDPTMRRAMLVSAMGAGLLHALPFSLTAKTLESSKPVETTTGKVFGGRSRGVSAFLGIPYGADTSTRRFQQAEVPVPWSGLRDCTAYGPQAPQMEFGAAAVAGPGADLNSDFVKQIISTFRAGMEVGNESENCLVLNVYTPEALPLRKLAWPAYDTASRQTMIFDIASHVVSDPDGEARTFWLPGPKVA